MSRFQSIQLRGQEFDVEIDLDGGYESDTNAHVIEWHFVGMSPEQHEALKLTDDEEQAIYDELCAASDSSRLDDDVI